MSNTVKRAEGCRFAHVAPMKISTGKLSYDAYIPVVGLESITTTPVFAELSAFSDNQQDTNRKKPIAYDISIVLRELSQELEALFMGQTYENGRKYTSTNDVQNPVAFAYQQTNSDGTYTNILYYNVTLSRESRENTSVTDSVEFNSVTLSGRAIPISSGELELVINSDDSEANPSDLENFFTKVLMPDDEVSVDAMEPFNRSMQQLVEEYKAEMNALKKENKELKLEKSKK